MLGISKTFFFHRCLHLGNLQKKRLTSNIYLDDLQITSDYLMNHELRLKQLHYVLNTFDSGKKCQKVFFNDGGFYEDLKNCLKDFTRKTVHRMETVLQ